MERWCQERRRTGLRNARLLLAFTALSTSAACAGKTDAAAPQPTAAPVHVVAARNGVISPTQTLAGVIAPYRNIGISSSLAEPVAEVDVHDGDRVRAGQVLARLDIDDLDSSLASAERVTLANAARTSATAQNARLAFAQDNGQIRNARAAVAQAQTTLAGARRDLQRAQSLVDNGYLAQQTLDQEQTAVLNDQQSLVGARASLQNTLENQNVNGSLRAGLQGANVTAARAEQGAAEASVEQIRRELARATLVAPVDAEIVNVNVEPGEYPSGRQLFTLQENDRVFAILSASGLDAFRILTGAGAVARVLGDDGGSRFRGRVSAVLDQVAPGSTNFAIKVELPNPEHRLHAGLPVSADVTLPSVHGVALPLRAFTNDLRTEVLVLQNGVVHTAHVTEKADDGTTAIVAGLDPGANVIFDGTTNVAAGDRATAIR